MLSYLNVILGCNLTIYSFHFLLDEKVMSDDEFTCDLFRFLQLLCEGHNNGEDESCFKWEEYETQTKLNISLQPTLSSLTDFQNDVSFAADFQNYLRTQTGSTTTINIIICTVDYLLRLQVQLFI